MHFLLARSLREKSASQARLEYRFASQDDPALQPVAMVEGSRLVGSFEDALELSPPGNADSLERISENVAARLPATSERIDERLMTADATLLAPRLRMARRRTADLEALDAAPWCANDRARCIAAAIEAAKQAIAVDPGGYEGMSLLARAKIDSGKPAAALDELARKCDDVDRRVACLETLVDLASKVGDAARLDNAIARLERSGCGSDEECLASERFLAGIELSRRHPSSALVHFKRALDKNPDDELLLAQCAQAASDSGLHVEAKSYYVRLGQRHPGDARWADAARREANAALKETAP